MKWIGCLAGLLTLSISSAAKADLITPTSAFASTYYNANLSPTQAINNSGLNTSSGNVLTYTHEARADGVNTWITGQGQGGGGSTPPITANQYIVFDLGANYDLSAAYLWQLVQGNQVDRGLKEFRLLASPNAPSVSTPPSTYNLTGFVEILPTSILSIGVANTPASTQTFTLAGATNVRQIYLDVISAHNGLTNSYVGLSEIKFEGSLLQSDTYHWNNAAGGSWHNSNNWLEAATPGGNDQAVFALPDSYTTTVASFVSIDKLSVADGEVTFNVGSSALQAKTLEVTGGKLKVANLSGAGAPNGHVGYTEALEWSGGVIEVNGGVFAPKGRDYNAGNGFTRALAVSGVAGSTERPQLQLTGGANYYAAPGGFSSDGAVLIGILGGRGHAVVTDNSRLVTPTGQGQLVVGGHGAVISSTWRPGDGILEVSGGGAAGGSLGVFIGFSGGIGAATIEGLGSSLSSTNPIYVGYEVAGTSSTPYAAQGRLLVCNQATASGSWVIIGANGAQGHVTVDGPSSKLQATAAGGQLAVGFQNNASRGLKADGLIEVLNGGRVVAANIVQVGVDFQSVGRIVVDGPNSTLSAGGHLRLGSNGVGSLDITNGGVVSFGTDIQAGLAAGSGSIIVGRSDGTDTGGSRLEANNLTLGAANSQQAQLAIHSGGQVALRGGLTTVLNNGASQPSVGLHGGTLQAQSATFADISHLEWTSGALWLDGGTGAFGLANSVLVTPANGVLKGHGTIGNQVDVLGVLSPGDGNESATFHLQRDLTIGAAGERGTLAADLDFQSLTSDLLTVDGAVNLTNAELALSLHGAPLGDLPVSLTFLLVERGGVEAISTVFNSVDLGIYSPSQFVIDYQFAGTAVNGVGAGNDIAITFTSIRMVPEPSTALLLIAASVGLLGVRRARRRR